MIKIIETNYNEVSFQSRVIEVESWDYVIKQFTTEIATPKSFTDIYGNYEGVIIPRFKVIKNLNYSDDTLMCDVYTLSPNKKIVKLIQRV